MKVLNVEVEDSVYDSLKELSDLWNEWYKQEDGTEEKENARDNMWEAYEDMFGDVQDLALTLFPRKA